MPILNTHSFLLFIHIDINESHFTMYTNTHLCLLKDTEKTTARDFSNNFHSTKEEEESKKNYQTFEMRHFNTKAKQLHDCVNLCNSICLSIEIRLNFFLIIQR